MSKIINCSIDLNSISPDKVKNHTNGCRYFNFTVMERTSPDERGNTHYVVEAQTKEERLAKAPKNFLKSSGKAFDFGNNGGAKAAAVANQSDDEDDLPF